MSFEIMRAIAEGVEEMALVTVIDVQGSAPRHAGSKMLVAGGADGAHVVLGTVGGGQGEARAIEAAGECIASGSFRLLTLEFQGVETEGQDMICGGSSRLMVESLRDRAPYRLAFERLNHGERVVLVREHGEADVITVAVLDRHGAALHGSASPRLGPSIQRALDTGAPSYLPEERAFVDPLFPEEKLLILGGGYIGQALAWHAQRLDFRVTVGDDRREFSDAGRFPAGVAATCGSYAQIIEGFPFDSATYVVMVTRGHLTDLECARAVLRRPYRYAGFIGSRRKARLLREQLAADGHDRRRIDELHAPIGLEIGAETPEELAVAILAELVAVRRNVGSRNAAPADRGA